MSKKGATKTGGSTTRAKDAERAKHLRPSPKAWNPKPEWNPGGNNAGARHRRRKAG